MDPNNIKLEQTTALSCEKCQCELFTEVVMIRKVSRFITGTNQDSIIPIPVFACNDCQHVNKEFLPTQLQNG